MKRLIALAALVLPLAASGQTPGEFAREMVSTHEGRIPRMIAPGVRVDDVSSTPEGVFSMTYTLTEISLEDMDPAWVASIPGNTVEVCSTPALIPAFNAGVLMEYIFRDRAGKFVNRAVATKASCARQ